MANRKLFVLDTNVPLHDSKCMYQFEENDIVIPITVIEELDNFKKGNESLNFHAREFVRAVDALAQQPLFSKGVRSARDWATSWSRSVGSITKTWSGFRDPQRGSRDPQHRLPVGAQTAQASGHPGQQGRESAHEGQGHRPHRAGLPQ